MASDRALALLRPGVEVLCYLVESGKRASEGIARPVLLGDRGTERVSYEVDAVHDGRGARGNAVYRDLVRSSLIVGARSLILGVMQEYRHRSGGKDVTIHSYLDSKNQLDAVFDSGRPKLPFEGILVFGY